MRIMRILKMMLTIFVLGALIFSFVSCGAQSADGTQTGNQTAIVQRGNLTIAVTAVGNLEFSHTEDLAIDLFYGQSGSAGIKGTVGEVLVEEGDTVKEGQVLVTVDQDEWDKQLSTLEDAVTSAERQLTAKQLALLQAQISQKNAEIDLEDTEAQYIWPEDVFTARQAVWNAEAALKEAQQTLNGEAYVYDRTTGQYVLKEVKTKADIEYWTQKVADAEETLGKAQASLDSLLAQVAGDTPEVTIKRLQLELANGDVDDAQAAIEVAQKSVEDAQKALDDAKAKSPIITAPFDGFITQVNVAGGDEVLNGTVAVQIADPSKFEAEVMVGEMDIMQVNIGGTASVQVDAMPGISLPATVTHISPTATIQSGVVNYTVKVEIQPTEAIKQAQPEAMPPASANTSSSGLPPRLQQAVDAGSMTQAQSEAMTGQFQRGQSGQQGKVSTAMPANLQLKEGLTVTVNIITDERNNVLLVPNSAITTQGGKTFVQVLAADGTQERREIQTGLSDYRSTEVTSGLSEGEQIVVPQGTVTTTSTTQSGQRPQGGMFIPGMGRAR